MQIVELTELFIEDVFEWRNDKITRAMSFSSEKLILNRIYIGLKI